MRSRREYALAEVGMLAGGGLSLLAAQAAWVQVRAAGAAAGGVVLVVDVPGSEASALVVPLSLVALAGALGVVATRGVARRMVGVLVAVSGVAVAVDALRVVRGPAAAVAGALAHRSVDAQAAGAAAYSCSWWWPVLAALGGSLVVGAGALIALRGGRWPAMGARYDAPRAASDRPGDAWDALDRGEDPTLPPAEPMPVPETPEPPEPPEPDSRAADLPE